MLVPGDRIPLEATVWLDPREGKFERVVTTRPAKVDRLRAESKHDWLVITLTEGKSRQIHRMVEALGYQVVKLQRLPIAFGARIAGG